MLDLERFAVELRAFFQTFGTVTAQQGVDGWTAFLHIQSADCAGWVIPQRSTVMRVQRSRRSGYADGDPEVSEHLAIVGAVDCACGKFREMLIEMEGSMEETYLSLMGVALPEVSIQI